MIFILCTFFSPKFLLNLNMLRVDFRDSGFIPGSPKGLTLGPTAWTRREDGELTGLHRRAPIHLALELRRCCPQAPWSCEPREYGMQ